MEKVWLKSYPKGIKSDADIKSYKSLIEAIDVSFSKFADRPSFHCMGKTITFEELDTLSKKFASYLQNNLGLKKGARVAIMMPNILQYPVAAFGILRAGMIVVNVNPLYTERELEHQLNDSGAEVLVIFENSAHVAEQILSHTKVKHVVVTGIGDMLGFPKAMIVNFVIRHVKKMVPKWSLPGSISFNALMADANESKYRKEVATLDDTAFLQYTGGTTGVSKGAILTHGNIVANVAQVKEWLGANFEEGNEIIITPLPLYHIFSLTANCLFFNELGALRVLITNPRDMPGFIAELNKWKFTALTGVNTLFNGLLAQDDFKNVDFSSLKLTLGGGMAVQKAVADKWRSVTGGPLVEAYGLTETSPAACINPFDLVDYNGYVGLPIPSTDVAILDDDEKEVPIGERGEISIRGPQVMKGYWQRPEATDEVMTKDGFFKTGDIGVMTDDGYVKIVDRKKDMILVSGFNVYPNEIEDVVVRHPKVLEVAAIGLPDEKSGEVVKLFVVKRDQSLTQDELKEFCKENLTGYKVPKAYEFRDDLPKSNVGKILRKELRPS